MKLVINIPCYNEEKTLPLVLRELPKKIKGVSEIIVQIVDDGSTDKTVAVAKKLGVKNIIIHKKNKGLGIAFKHGMQAALDLGADIFVNTDADNQYPSKYIPALVEPVVKQRADLVIGNRKPWKVKHFSPLKRGLQWFGNGLTRKILGSNVPDTVSGFRAYSKDAMLRINVVTKFSYVLDTIMQAVQKDLRIESIEISTNAPTRDSRLFKNIFQHMQKSGVNLIRIFYLYEPLKTFLYASLVPFVLGLALLIRWFYFYFNNLGGGNLQSLIMSLILLITAGLLFGLGIIGDSMKANRMLIEDTLYSLKKKDYDVRK
ncbi:MAG: glycosyltransferase [Nanoarchaeota archaeon]|nr:glycosyltransferase [Nanoarchaeota archaeon]MBU1444775.1 glycosyltransferase [Nanoarchaeota archaeon]MBU2420063.1 glycosyltransferase [Nanoarchaeota archaeon]MBU2474904.1 glycosyltransferase [Nanoarchaeota archaeon]